MNTRRDVLKTLMTCVIFPLSAIGFKIPQIDKLIPFQLNVEGEGLARDRYGRIHQINDPFLSKKVGKIRVNGRLVEGVQEFNTEEGWVKGFDFKKLKDGFETSSFVIHGNVTVEWEGLAGIDQSH